MNIIIIIQLKWEIDLKIKIFFKILKLKIIIELNINDMILINNEISIFILSKMKRGITF